MKQTYVFQPELGPPHRYDVNAEGIVYHPPGTASRAVRWEDVRYLEDVSGRKVDLVATAGVSIPLFYGIQDFGALMDAVCARLAALHREKLDAAATFRGTRGYFAHRMAVLGVFAALILACVVYSQDRPVVWMSVVAITLPMAVAVLRQPHTVTPREDGLVIADALGSRIIAYRDIAAIGFALHGDKHTAYLCILAHLTDGRRIKIQRFDNLVLLYLFIQTRMEKNRNRP